MSLITKFTLGQVSQTSLDLHPHYLNPHLLPPWRTKDEGSEGKGALSVCVFSGAEALTIRRCKMMAWTRLIYIFEIFMEILWTKVQWSYRTTKTQECSFSKAASQSLPRLPLQEKKQANMYLCSDGKQISTQSISLTFSMFF